MASWLPSIFAPSPTALRASAAADCAAARTNRAARRYTAKANTQKSNDYTKTKEEGGPAGGAWWFHPQAGGVGELSFVAAPPRDRHLEAAEAVLVP